LLPSNWFAKYEIEGLEIMSYVFNIWNPNQSKLPRPKSLEEAWATLHALEDAQVVLGSEFTQLAAQLTQLNQSSSINSASHDDMDEEQESQLLFEGDLKQDLQLAREMHSGQWAISPASGQGNVHMRALHELLKVALPLGLCVFDGQVGIYFDSQQGLLPQEMHEYWQLVLQSLAKENSDLPDHHPEKKLNKKTIVQTLTKYLSNLGFDELKQPKGKVGYLCHRSIEGGAKDFAQHLHK
jgi:hypothetical protein